MFSYSRSVYSLIIQKSPFDASNFDSRIAEKNWNEKELALADFSEYIENDFEIINGRIVMNMDLIRHLGSGGFGDVNINF